MSLPAAALTGVVAALRTPLWLRGDRWRELLVPPADAVPGRAAPRGAAGGALRMVRLLSALPGSPWKNTCLYQSVAHCLALRRYGVPAVVRIGVKAGETPEEPILAHAWVVADPTSEPEPPQQMLPFALRA